jgi:hypothetical protein
MACQDSSPTGRTNPHRLFAYLATVRERGSRWRYSRVVQRAALHHHRAASGTLAGTRCSNRRDSIPAHLCGNGCRHQEQHLAQGPGPAQAQGAFYQSVSVVIFLPPSFCLLLVTSCSCDNALNYFSDVIWKNELVYSLHSLLHHYGTCRGWIRHAVVLLSCILAKADWLIGLMCGTGNLCWLGAWKVFSCWKPYHIITSNEYRVPVFQVMVFSSVRIQSTE